MHTIQTPRAFAELECNGVLYPDPALAEESFVDAYDWMYRQMSIRLGTEVRGALWLWARISRSRLVDLCKLNVGELLLTCQIPRERVLLSHFVDWHSVLNRGLVVPRNVDEPEVDWMERWDVISDEFDDRVELAGVSDKEVGRWPEDLRSEIEGSWENIFNCALYGRCETWQATVGSLRASDVKDVVRIS